MAQDTETPVWVLADDRTGDVAQCVGVAEALGIPFARKTIVYDRLAALHNLMRGPTLIGIAPDSRAGLCPPWPRLVIACGRRTAPVARWIKRQSGAFVVQIMDPGAGGRSDIDLFAIPLHDHGRFPKARVVRILGAPHRVTPARLAEAAALWRPRWQHLPRPWLAVIVGGNTHRRDLPIAMAHALATETGALAAAAGGSILLTTSRRTGCDAEQAFMASVPAPRFIHLWGSSTGENPYFALLALADAVVVTGESTSMCTESTLCPKPVYLWAPPGWSTAKYSRLHRDLFAGGYARPFDDAKSFDDWPHPALNPAGEIADAIRARLPDLVVP